MTTWEVAMIVALLVGIISPVDRGPRARAWAATMVGSLAAYLYPNLWYYLALDVAVAAIILLPPRTSWQRAIGFCFVVMVLLSIGYAIHDLAALHIFLSPAGSPAVLKETHDYLGWVACGLLLLWGGSAILGTYLHRASDSSGVSAAAPRRPQ